MSDDVSPAPSLPDALMPVMVESCRLALEHSADDGRLMYEPDGYDYLNAMPGIACLAAVLVTEHPDNPLHRNDQLADLVRRAGRFMVRHHLDPKMNPPGSMWYDGREVHEWAYELWIDSYRTLRDHGAAELTEGWEDGLRAGGEVFHRWIRDIRLVRKASSPNLNISPNHFAFFILDALEYGLMFDVAEARDDALERARWLTAQIDPDGYWEETDGPTTSYNFITTAAVGWWDDLTGKQEILRSSASSDAGPSPLGKKGSDPFSDQTTASVGESPSTEKGSDPFFPFLDALKRSLAFHTRYIYPDGCFLETIDQRIRYRAEPLESYIWTLQAFSNFPEGRAFNAFIAGQFDAFRKRVAFGHRMGRLAKAFMHYVTGDVAPTPKTITHGAYQLSRPGGIVKDGTWAVGLCGIPSRPRPHRFTMDRMNLLSVWHRDAGLIIGGGNARDQPFAATFHKRVALDPQATAEGLTEMDVYTPVRGALDLNDRGGTLTVGYWGWDAEITAEIVDDRTLRLTAGAWGRTGMMPVSFTPNIRLVPDVPLVTASGREITIDGTEFELTAEEIGDWFGQGTWRLSVPTDATLIYPFRPRTSREPDTVPVGEMYGLLTIPLTNETVTLEVRVV